MNCSSILPWMNLEKDYIRIKADTKNNTAYANAGSTETQPQFKTEFLLSLPPHLHN